MRGRVLGKDLKGRFPQAGHGHSALLHIWGQSGLPCDLQTKLEPWPAAVGSQAGQWEEGESMEIKPRAQASGPRIPEAGSSNPSERRLHVNMGWVSCAHRARAGVFIVLLLLR